MRTKGKNTTPRKARTVRARLAEIADSHDERTALRIIALYAQGHTLARALRTVKLTDKMNNQKES